MIPYRLLGALVGVGLIVGAVAWFIRYERDQGIQQGRAEIQAKWDARDVEDARQSAKETLRRLTAQENAQRVHDQELQLAQRDAAGARAAADRLRDQLAAIVAASRRHPPASSDSPPAGDPIGVLADVLGRADERAGVLAAYADAARIAGLQCERSYEALTSKP